MVGDYGDLDDDQKKLVDEAIGSKADILETPCLSLVLRLHQKSFQPLHYCNSFHVLTSSV